MKKYLFAAAAMALGFSSNAHAALTINISGSSGAFGNPSVLCGVLPKPCSFTNVANFVTPTGYRLVGATITTNQTGQNETQLALTNIDFTSVTLNGVNFILGPNGVVEGGYLLNQLMVPGGVNELSVSGLSGGGASYGGSLSFAEVPEPSTWLMMILGVGIAGAALRRRRQAVKVRYA
jgi:hypothetical protein